MNVEKKLWNSRSKIAFKYYSEKEKAQEIENFQTSTETFSNDGAQAERMALKFSSFTLHSCVLLRYRFLWHVRDSRSKHPLEIHKFDFPCYDASFCGTFISHIQSKIFCIFPAYALKINCHETSCIHFACSTMGWLNLGDYFTMKKSIYKYEPNWRVLRI